MIKTTFIDKEQFLKTIQKTNQLLENDFNKINTILNDQGYPLKKETYHFLTQIIKPETRIEKVFYSLLFQTIHKTEILSAGSGWIAMQFANRFFSSLMKKVDLQNKNEVELLEEFEKVCEEFKQVVADSSSPIRASELKRCISAHSQDSLLLEAILAALTVSGLEGKIHIEEGILSNYSVEQKLGYFFKDLKPFKFMIPQSGYWEASNVKIMLIDGLLEKVSELDKILNGAMTTKTPVLLIAHGFSEEIIATIKINVDNNKFNIMPIRLPIELESLNVMNDIAAVCGADVISTLKGQMVVFTEFDTLPTVEKIRLNLKELGIENNKTRAGVSQHLRMLLEKRVTSENTAGMEEMVDFLDKRIQTLLSASVIFKLPNLTSIKKDSVKTSIDIILRTVKTLLNHGQVNIENISEHYKNKLKTLKPNDQTIENVFTNVIVNLIDKINIQEVMPSLSFYSGIYFMGKMILSIISTNGLIQIEEKEEAKEC